MSSRAWRMETKHKPWGRITRPVIDLLFAVFGRRNHCATAYADERHKAPLPD